MRSHQQLQLMKLLPHPPHTLSQHCIPGSFLIPRPEVVNVRGNLGNSSLPDRISGMLKWCSASLRLIDREGRAVKTLWKLEHTLGRKVLLFSCGPMMMATASSCI